MLVDPPMEEMLPKTACAYELAVLVAQRACQLVDGAQPMVGDSAANMVSLACREIAQDKVVVVRGDHSKEVVIPKSKEARMKEAEERRKREEQENYRRETELIEEAAAKEAPVEEPTDMQELFETVEEEYVEVAETSDEE